MTPWRAASRAYYGHHAGCGVCQAAGQKPGILPRCDTGAQLWAEYEAQPLPAVLAGRVWPGGVMLGVKSGVNSVPGKHRAKKY